MFSDSRRAVKEDVRTKEKDDSKNTIDPVESQYEGLLDSTAP